MFCITAMYQCGMLSPNSKSAMDPRAKAVTALSLTRAVAACRLHSPRCKYPERKHGKQSLRADMKRHPSGPAVPSLHPISTRLCAMGVGLLV